MPWIGGVKGNMDNVLAIAMAFKPPYQPLKEMVMLLIQLSRKTGWKD